MLPTNKVLLGHSPAHSLLVLVASCYNNGRVEYPSWIIQGHTGIHTSASFRSFFTHGMSLWNSSRNTYYFHLFVLKEAVVLDFFCYNSSLSLTHKKLWKLIMVCQEHWLIVRWTTGKTPNISGFHNLSCWLMDQCSHFESLEISVN